MVRQAVVPILVLSAAAWFTAPGLHAASQQSDELKQIKADLKLGLAQAKTGTDAAVSIFSQDIALIQAKVANGSQNLTFLADDLGDVILTAAHDIEQANQEACGNAATQIAAHASVTLANSTLPGGGGDFDKFLAAQNALMAKANKKMLGILLKFQKAAAKSASTPVAVNILLFPFQLGINVTSDHNSNPATNVTPNAALVVLIGISNGHVFAGGLADEFASINVFFFSTSHNVTPTNEIWRFKDTGQTPGNTAVFLILATSGDARLGRFAIGVPSAP